MLLTCNECNTQYRLPEGSITEKGRKVKCKNCSHIWFQDFISEDETTVEKEVSEKADKNTASDDKKISKPAKEKFKIKKPKFKKTKIVKKAANTNLPTKISKSLVISFVVLLIITSFSLSLYGEFFPSMFGQEKVDNIIFNDMTMEKKRGDTGWDIGLKISLKNTADEYQKIPPIHINIMSKGNRVMNHFILNAEVNEIPPKEVITTERVLENIAGSAEKITFDIGNSWELSFRN